MNLESPKVKVGKSQEDTFAFLSDVKNFKHLMPENIAKFEMLDEESFVFALSGMPEIKLKLTEKQTFNKVALGAVSDKLPFTLVADIQSVSEGQSEVQLNFSGEFNPMIQMMIKGPIGKFINTLAENLSKQ
jgi:carbon monoxide dehydrogenase subunit G